MAETRAERLARIRAVLDADESEIEVSAAEDTSGAWCRDGAFRSLLIDDLRWLLSQVSDTLEYRVEGWAQIDGRGPFAWSPWNGPYPEMRHATEMLAWKREHKPDMRWRITCRPAPVEVWTPVEEEEAS